jgi:phosphoglycerate kinase
MPKKSIRDLTDLQGKKVLVRVDFNVPLDKKKGDGTITNDRRIRGALPTIKHLLDSGASVICMSHLGRPSGDPVKDAPLKMDKVALRLGELLGKPVKKASDQVVGDEVIVAVKEMKPGDVLVLENLRFDKREQKNDAEFAKAIGELGDVYVNDAFGTCHNDSDASMVAVPASMKGKPRVVGYLVEKELKIIDGLLEAPKRPFMGIMGGAKVSDKIEFINTLLSKVDHLLIGGKMTYTFLKATGVDMGSCDISEEELTAAKGLIHHVGTKITLPVDYLIAKTDDLNATQYVEGAIPQGFSGVDIGPKTLALYVEKIKSAGTVIWNGPVGWFEQVAFSIGTKTIAEAMANSSATTVVGGGETAEAVEKFGFDSKITHVSTGGGAFLAYVENPAFESLKQIEDV